MITAYLTLYLVFIIFVSVMVGLMVIKLKLPSPGLIATLIVIFVVSPLIAGYLYIAYFNSLPETVVPDVVGAPQEIAVGNIEVAGLRARIAGSINEIKYPEGSVVSQRPEAGRRVKAGRVVSLMLSSGKRKTTAPNLLGRNYSQVGELLSAVGLRWGEVRAERNSDVPEGTIIAQEPLPGEETEVDRPVDLIVATTLESKMLRTTSEVE
jgi:serine/threonine-protein kinase